MCSTPDIPSPPPPPPPPQVAKMPEMGLVRKRSPMAPLSGMGGTASPGLLTGTQGVANSSLNVSSTQLLGGGQ